MKKFITIPVFISMNLFGMQSNITKPPILKRHLSKVIMRNNSHNKRSNTYSSICNKLFAAVRKQSIKELEELQKYEIPICELNLALDFTVNRHSHSKAEVVEWLLKKGANPEQKDTLGHTLLINAFKRGFLKIVEVLLEHGANPDTKNILGDTLIITAFNDRNLKLIDLLLQHGAKNDILELLVTAIKNNDFDIVNLLLQYGADINQKYKNGLTPIAIAEQNNKVMMNLLLEYGAVNQ